MKKYQWCIQFYIYTWEEARVNVGASTAAESRIWTRGKESRTTLNKRIEWLHRVEWGCEWVSDWVYGYSLFTLGQHEPLLIRQNQRINTRANKFDK